MFKRTGIMRRRIPLARRQRPLRQQRPKARAWAMLERLPDFCWMEWCEYKGEVWVAQPNYEATLLAGKPMLDLSYCLTRAINQCILRTVQYDKNKFRATTRRN